MAPKVATNPPPPPFRVAGPDLKGLVLLLVSIITLMALLDLGPGALNAPMARALRWLVGWGAFPLALLVGIIGLLVLLRFWGDRAVNWGRALALELLALCGLGLLTLAVNPSLSWQTATAGQGGGALGWLVASVAGVVGTTGGFLLLLGLALLLMPLALRVSLGQLQEALEQQRQALQQRRARLLTPDPSPAAPLPTARALARLLPLPPPL